MCVRIDVSEPDGFCEELMRLAMTDIDSYWKRLVSTGLRFLQEQGSADAAAVICRVVQRVL